MMHFHVTKSAIRQCQKADLGFHNLELRLKTLDFDIDDCAYPDTFDAGDRLPRLVSVDGHESL
jgi:hypothetical protein